MDDRARDHASDSLRARDTAGWTATSDPAVLRRAISRTQADMQETLDVIQDRLAPRNLARQAGQTVRDATIGRAETMMNDAGETVRHTQSTLMDTMRHNPIATTMVGVGLGWLFMQARRDRPSDRWRSDARWGYMERPGQGSQQDQASERMGQAMGQAQSQVRSRTGEARERVTEMASEAQHQVQEVASQAQARASDLSDQAQYRARQTQQTFNRMLHERPLAVALLAAGAGMAIGLMLPETQAEQKAMGGAREEVTRRAQEMIEDTTHKVERVVDEGTSAAQREAQSQGMPGTKQS